MLCEKTYVLSVSSSSSSEVLCLRWSANIELELVPLQLLLWVSVCGILSCSSWPVSELSQLYTIIINYPPMTDWSSFCFSKAPFVLGEALEQQQQQQQQQEEAQIQQPNKTNSWSIHLNWSNSAYLATATQRREERPVPPWVRRVVHDRRAVLK